MPQGAKAMKMPAGQTDSLASIPERGSPLRNSAVVAKKATERPPEEAFKLFRSIVLGHRVKM